MTTIRQHIPGFITGVDPETAEFEGLAGLLEVPFVKLWAEDPRFDRFALASDSRHTDHLMAEMTDGKFWVVGFIPKGEAPAELPAWEYHP